MTVDPIVVVLILMTLKAFAGWILLCLALLLLAIAGIRGFLEGAAGR